MATVYVFQIIKLLDRKRSQAVGILISSLHLEMKDIQQGAFHALSCVARKQLGVSAADTESELTDRNQSRCIKILLL